jgi:phage-related protein
VRAPLDNPRVTWGEHQQTIANAVPIGSATAAYPVTFPAGYFTTSPNVVATVSTVVGGTAGLVARITNVTKNGFDVIYYNLGAAQIAGGTVARAMWQAIGY